MASSFGQKISIPDTAKDPTSACGVCARKIRGSESPVIGRQQFTMVVVSGKIFIPCQRLIKIVKVEIDGAAIYRQESEIVFLP